MVLTLVNKNGIRLLCTSHLKPIHLPIRALAGTFTSYTLQFGSPRNSLEVTVFTPPTGLFAGRSKINLFVSWLPTVFFNQCVTLGNNKLFYKGSTMYCWKACWNVGAGEYTTHFFPREAVTSLSFTCIKSECPAQARMGGCGGFKRQMHWHVMIYIFYPQLAPNCVVVVMETFDWRPPLDRSISTLLTLKNVEVACYC